MSFRVCVNEVAHSDRSLVDACLQVLFDDEMDLAINILLDLSRGESAGTEYAFIFLESDPGDDCPDFKGVCFNYLDEYTVVSKEVASRIICCVIDRLVVEVDWKGF